MQQPIRASYLETDVMTATPEKLQTMLIDGAIKNLQRGRLLWNDNRDEEACESLIRAQQIIAQILAGFRREVDAELARKVAAIYLFLFRTIGEAQNARDEGRLEQCIRVLDVERQTWRLVCEKLEKERAANRAREAAPRLPGDSPTAPPRAAGPSPPGPPLGLWAGDAGGGGVSTGFSIEA